MNETTPWEEIYRRGEQLNAYPYSDVVAFCFHKLGAGGGTGKTALDVGCGSGIHSKLMSDFGANVHSIDFSPAVIEHAQRKFNSPSIKFQVSDFDHFDPAQKKFDLVIDRCSTTHSSLSTAETFYQDLKGHLNPNAKLFWQGFSWDNSYRKYGKEHPNGYWYDFDQGIFSQLGQTAFFKKGDLEVIFDGYKIENFRHISDQNVVTQEEHTSWILELTYE